MMITDICSPRRSARCSSRWCVRFLDSCAVSDVSGPGWVLSQPIFVLLRDASTADASKSSGADTLRLQVVSCCRLQACHRRWPIPPSSGYARICIAITIPEKTSFVARPATRAIFFYYGLITQMHSGTMSPLAPLRDGGILAGVLAAGRGVQ